MCYKDPPPRPRKTGKPARTSWSCCPALRVNLPQPAPPCPSASPPCSTPSHPFLLFSKKRWPWSFQLEWFSFLSSARTSLYLYVTAAFIQIPQLGDKLLWGQGSHLIHFCASTGPWLRIGAHKMHVEMNWWIPWPLNQAATEASPAQSEWKVSELIY